MSMRVSALVLLLATLTACAGQVREPLLDDPQRTARQQAWWDCMNRVDELEKIGVRAACPY